MIMSMLLGWTLKISFATNYQPAWPIYFLSIRYCDIIVNPNRQIFCSRLRKVHQFCLKLNRYITRQWRGEIFKTARNNLQADPGGHEQYICSAQDSLPAMSAMIDTETSVNHLVEHAANRKKLGKVQCGDVVFLVVEIVKSSRTFV